jgi:hypothetical protein
MNLGYLNLDAWALGFRVYGFSRFFQIPILSSESTEQRVEAVLLSLYYGSKALVRPHITCRRQRSSASRQRRCVSLRMRAANSGDVMRLIVSGHLKRLLLVP